MNPAFLLTIEGLNMPMHMEYAQFMGVMAKVQSMMQEARDEFPNAVSFRVLIRVSTHGTEVFINELEAEAPSDKVH